MAATGSQEEEATGLATAGTPPDEGRYWGAEGAQPETEAGTAGS